MTAVAKLIAYRVALGLTACCATVTMADAAENQAEDPQQRVHSPGWGFPIMRMVVFFA